MLPFVEFPEGGCYETGTDRKNVWTAPQRSVTRPEIGSSCSWLDDDDQVWGRSMVWSTTGSATGEFSSHGIVETYVMVGSLILFHLFWSNLNVCDLYLFDAYLPEIGHTCSTLIGITTLLASFQSLLVICGSSTVVSIVFCWCTYCFPETSS